MQLLTPIDGQSHTVNQRYWKWVDENVLDSMRSEEREAFGWLLEQAKILIGHAVEHGEDMLKQNGN